ncbi:MAG: hypothetical protein V1797_19330 [Pseudomonadota bacterium]
MRLISKGCAAGLGAFCLALGWLGALAGVTWAAPAQPVQQDGIALGGFRLSHTGAARIADRLQVSFEVTNTGAAPIRLGEKFGAFAAARWSTKTHRKLNRDFGHQARGKRLAPGAVLKVQASLILDMPGDWSIWPAVQVGEKIIAFEELAQALKVTFGSEPAPASDAETAPPPVNGGQTVVLWQDEELPLQVFPPDNPWNLDISQVRKHPMSAQWIETMGPEISLRAGFGSGNRNRTTSIAAGRGLSFGTPYTVVRTDQKMVQIQFELAGQSNPGPYPIPVNPPTEGAGYDHIIVLHYDQKKLYEVQKAERMGPLWYGLSGAIFDLTSNRLRDPSAISAADSGLPIFPGLVRWEEVNSRKSIDHALCFSSSRTQKAYILPATHAVGDSRNPAWPPLGARVRLKRDFDISGFPASVQVILTALKTYGMFLADQGKDWQIAGAPDDRWMDEELDSFKNVKGHDFEVVDTGVLIQ